VCAGERPQHRAEQAGRTVARWRRRGSGDPVPGRAAGRADPAEEAGRDARGQPGARQHRPMMCRSVISRSGHAATGDCPAWRARAVGTDSSTIDSRATWALAGPAERGEPATGTGRKSKPPSAVMASCPSLPIPTDAMAAASSGPSSRSPAAASRPSGRRPTAADGGRHDGRADRRHRPWPPPGTVHRRAGSSEQQAGRRGHVPAGGGVLTPGRLYPSPAGAAAAGWRRGAEVVGFSRTLGAAEDGRREHDGDREPGRAGRRAGALRRQQRRQCDREV